MTNTKSGAIIALMLVSVSLTLTNCSEDETGTNSSDRTYSLVWEDNFDGAAGTSPDANIWNFEVGDGTAQGIPGWGNNELQYYTDRPENASLDGNGNLVITAIEESYQGSSYTSARMTTQNNRFQTYGRFEARIKTPFGRGMWPAFWMLGTDIVTDGWPECGEIDIMELVGNEMTKIHGSIHGPGYSGGNAIGDSYDDGTRFDDDFHIFAIEWGEDYIDYYVDDQLYQSISKGQVTGNWVYDNDFFLILNVAVGGTWPGPPSATTQFPQTMTVDYVRVYQEVIE